MEDFFSQVPQEWTKSLQSSLQNGLGSSTGAVVPPTESQGRRAPLNEGPPLPSTPGLFKPSEHNTKHWTLPREFYKRKTQTSLSLNVSSCTEDRIQRLRNRVLSLSDQKLVKIQHPSLPSTQERISPDDYLNRIDIPFLTYNGNSRTTMSTVLGSSLLDSVAVGHWTVGRGSSAGHGPPTGQETGRVSWVREIVPVMKIQLKPSNKSRTLIEDVYDVRHYINTVSRLLLTKRFFVVVESFYLWDGGTPRHRGRIPFPGTPCEVGTTGSTETRGT